MTIDITAASASVATLPLNPLTTVFGEIAPQSLTVNGHVWTADSSGQYQTGSDLATEWSANYQIMLSGKGSTLNDIQRLEGNAEAVFENTALKTLSTAQLKIDRQDVQREFDAMAAAMQSAGISLNGALTQQSYLLLEQTLQSNVGLEELAMQGHGLNNPPAAKYNGYTNDFQNNVDKSTLYIGGGLNNNKNAIKDFFDDNIISHLPFPTAPHDGTLVQLNQNGAPENILTNAIAALDDSMVYRTYDAADFALKSSSINAGYKSPALAILATEAAAPIPAGEIKTLSGVLIANSITSTAHNWVADANGLFVTSTDLASEWHSAYVDLITTGGKDLTAEQRLEANAEAVFENTGLSKLSAAQQQIDREDAQRQFDAEFAAMQIAGINPNLPLTASSYLALAHCLQTTASLEELAIQGHGLNDPHAARYNGYTNDFQHNVDTTTLYVGGGLNNGKAAITAFFDDNILSHLPFPVVVHNGVLVQLNQNAAVENTLNSAVNAINNAIHYKGYDAFDFRAITTG